MLGGASSLAAPCVCADGMGGAQMYMHALTGQKLTNCRILVGVIVVLIFASIIDVMIQLTADVKRTYKDLKDAHAQEKEELRRVTAAENEEALEDTTPTPRMSFLSKLRTYGITSFLTPLVQELLFDTLVMIILPLVYVTLRIIKIETSQANYNAMVGGETGVTGVEWTNSEIPLREKVQDFFYRCARVKEHLVDEDQMALLGFMASLMLLLRVLLATKLHPRIAGRPPSNPGLWEGGFR
eukprot:2657290-Rhodomonas_salina.1